jgi:phenylpropionate dioxygenase-like ring-hydroxylating dioxygenase large terminal subunit
MKPPLDERRIYYYLLWPSTFLSIHPDYLLVHRLEPAGVGHTRVVCQWLFEPETIAAPGFDPSDAIGFWDLTNRQDCHVCELQHRGTQSRSWTAGRYSNQEPSVHAFDLMAVDRYAGDGFTSRRTVRERYDVPAPQPLDANDTVGAVRLPRSDARQSSRLTARAQQG